MALATQATAVETLRVELQGGRTASGQLSSRTSEEFLWLRGAAAGIELQSGFAWSEIRSVLHSGRAYSAAEFRETARDLLGSLSQEPDPPPPLQKAAPIQPTVALLPASSPRVAALHIEGALARWDAFVPANGLIVTVIPTSAAGLAIPVRGDLQLTLFGASWPPPRGPVDRSSFRELARAYHIVRPEDFVAGRATYKLAFDRWRPEFDQLIEPYGLVHARLGVNGQGTFEASDPFVRLRSFSPLRDRRTLLGEPRFFPIESTRWPEARARAWDF